MVEGIGPASPGPTSAKPLSCVGPRSHLCQLGAGRSQQQVVSPHRAIHVQFLHQAVRGSAPQPRFPLEHPLRQVSNCPKDAKEGVATVVHAANRTYPRRALVISEAQAVHSRAIARPQDHEPVSRVLLLAIFDQANLPQPLCQSLELQFRHECTRH